MAGGLYSAWILEILFCVNECSNGSSERAMVKMVLRPQLDKVFTVM